MCQAIQNSINMQYKMNIYTKFLFLNMNLSI